MSEALNHLSYLTNASLYENVMIFIQDDMIRHVIENEKLKITEKDNLINLTTYYEYIHELNRYYFNIIRNMWTSFVDMHKDFKTCLIFINTIIHEKLFDKDKVNQTLSIN